MADTDPDDAPAEDGSLDSVDDLLWLIAEMPSAVSCADELLDDCAMRNIGCTVEMLDSLVASGMKQGLVDDWFHEGVHWYTLSPIAAKRIDVEIGRGSNRWYPRRKVPTADVDYEPGWTSAVDISDMVSSRYKPGDEHRPSKWQRTDPSIYTDFTCPEPIDVMIDAEFISDHGTLIGPSNRRLRDGSRVVIRDILGLNAPWPAAFDPAVIVGDGPARRFCRGCRRDLDDPQARLPRSAVCVVCHRSGVDHQLPPVEHELRQPSRRKYRQGHLSGGRGTAAG
jgi:hypothetical protein